MNGRNNTPGPSPPVIEKREGHASEELLRNTINGDGIGGICGIVSMSVELRRDTLNAGRVAPDLRR